MVARADRPISRAALRLRKHHLDKPDFAVRLWQHFDAGMLSGPEVGELLPAAWQRADVPEQVIGADKWCEMFRAAGFLLSPPDLPVPIGPVHLFRGATADRAQGMAWYLHPGSAAAACRHHARNGPTQVYWTTASIAPILAILKPDDAVAEVLVDPLLLGRVRPLAGGQSEQVA